MYALWRCAREGNTVVLESCDADTAWIFKAGEDVVMVHAPRSYIGRATVAPVLNLASTIFLYDTGDRCTAHI